MLKKAVVIRSTGKQYLLEDDAGQTYDCIVKGKFRLQGLKLTNPVAVGDIVEFNSETYVIEKICERDNYIIRQSPKKKHAQQIIASNIDQALLLSTVSMPRTSTGFMDRFLITAEAYHIPTTILFNKKDIMDEKSAAEVGRLMEVYGEAGYPCYFISSLNHEGLDQITDLIKDRVSLLCGHSGVGKTTFINAIIPGLELSTRDVSSYTQKGMHTTTFAEMHKLPFGGKLIDTPGIKEFGVLDFSPEEVSHYYPEMRPFLEDCKFHNCLHLAEPACEVRAAVERGEISEERYLNYSRIVESVKNAIKPWE